MNYDEFRPMPLIGTILLASALWFVTFYLTWSIFWIKISFSAAILAILSFWLQPYPRQHLKFNGSAIIIGLLSAAFLYLIFWTGKAVSAAILPFSGQQIGGIYAKGSGTSMWLIALLLSMIGVLVIAKDQIFLSAAVSQASTLGIALGMWAGVLQRLAQLFLALLAFRDIGEDVGNIEWLFILIEN